MSVDKIIILRISYTFLKPDLGAHFAHLLPPKHRLVDVVLAFCVDCTCSLGTENSSLMFRDINGRAINFIAR